MTWTIMVKDVSFWERLLPVSSVVQRSLPSTPQKTVIVTKMIVRGKGSILG